MKYSLLSLAVLATTANAATIQSADVDIFGPFTSLRFQVKQGAKTAPGMLTPQAAWYFQNEVIAVAADSTPGVNPAKSALQETRELATVGFGAAGPAGLSTEKGLRPPLVWLGASQSITGVTLGPDGTSLRSLDDSGPRTLPLKLVDKIPTNLSFYNEKSAAFFQGHPLKIRGEVASPSPAPVVTARSIWPTDFAARKDAVSPLQATESIRSLIQAEQGGASAPYLSRVLWANADSSWEGYSVIAFVLNGAQGDDDEAHGGHFAVATGRYQNGGDMSNWLVNNFYGINSNSEKGILAAPTPLDKYMGDLNNGQSFYRPSYMLVAIVKSDKLPLLYQGAMGRTFDHLYRHDMEYIHAKNNCAGLSLDAFKAMGWNVPEKGNSGTLKAIAAYGYVAATSGKLSEGQSVYNYLTAETTRLYPALTLETIGTDLLALAEKHRAPSSQFEKELQDDLAGLVYVRIPQFPSSRAMGLAPVFSFDQYMDQAPADRSEWKVVATTPKPFPAELRDGQARTPVQEPSVPAPVLLAAGGLLALLGGIATLVWRRVVKTPAQR